MAMRADDAWVRGLVFARPGSAALTKRGVWAERQPRIQSSTVTPGRRL